MEILISDKERKILKSFSSKGTVNVYFREGTLVFLKDTSEYFLYYVKNIESNINAFITLGSLEMQVILEEGKFEVKENNFTIYLIFSETIFAKSMQTEGNLESRIKGRLVEFDTTTTTPLSNISCLNGLQKLFNVADGFIIKDGILFSKNNSIVIFRDLTGFNLNITFNKGTYKILSNIVKEFKFLVFTSIGDYYIFRNGNMYIGLKEISSDFIGANLLKELKLLTPICKTEVNLEKLKKTLKYSLRGKVSLTVDLKKGVVETKSNVAGTVYNTIATPTLDTQDKFILLPEDIYKVLNILGKTGILVEYANHIELYDKVNRILIRKGAI